MKLRSTQKADVERPDIQDASVGHIEAVRRRGTQPTRRAASAALFPPNAILTRRYELKYRISESVAQAVKGFVRAFLPSDPYTRRWADGQYPICSLYLDSSQLHLFRETLLDKCNRFKLRIRGYDDEPDSPVFFEIKRKLNCVIYKSRAKAGKDQIGEILRGHFLPPQAEETDRAVLRQFVHYMQCLMARPVVLVRYHREAFENNSDERVRVTFDRRLSFQKTSEPVFKFNGGGWSRLPIDFVVLEIKFTGGFPLWLAEMVRLFNLNRQSMSKYCHSVRQLLPAGSEFL